jgi:NAD(P)H-dependent flavin oxidoreductase YrpB (nitropropane dioxygenase family)
MLKTRFTDLVGCAVPIQQAGMGTLSSPKLAAAISNAGALGIVSVAGSTPQEIADVLEQTRQLTSGVLGANFLIGFVPSEMKHECVAAAAARAKVVDFFYDDPDASLVETVHASGALASWQVGSLREAIAAEEAGCDFIIAQGIEAGGHVRGHIGLLALLGEVLDVIKIPVLAAGGIGTGRAMAAALAAGAEGVRIGTRFVAAEETEAHPTYVSALIAAEAVDTVYTDVFSYNWPNAPHRALHSCVEAAQAFEGDVVGQRFWPDTGEWEPVHRFQSLGVRNTATGAIEAMSLWAGESVGGIKRVQPAGEIVRELAEESEKLLRRW